MPVSLNECFPSPSLWLARPSGPFLGRAVTEEGRLVGVSASRCWDWEEEEKKASRFKDHQEQAYSLTKLDSIDVVQ